MNGVFVLAEGTALIETLRRIDQGNLQLVTIERDGKIVSTVTDGDVRRALLSGVGLDASVEQVMNRTPIVAALGISNAAALTLMRRHSIHQLPIMDASYTAGAAPKDGSGSQPIARSLDGEATSGQPIRSHVAL